MRSEYQQNVLEYVDSSLTELVADLGKLDMSPLARIAIDHCIDGIVLILTKVEE